MENQTSLNEYRVQEYLRLNEINKKAVDAVISLMNQEQEKDDE